jgi:hypothetical protein
MKTARHAPLAAFRKRQRHQSIEIARRRDLAKAEALQAWLGTVVAAFGDRVRPVDGAVAAHCSRHRRAPSRDRHGPRSDPRHLAGHDPWKGDGNPGLAHAAPFTPAS